MTKNCILALEENSKEVYLETSSMLLKLVDNVINHPLNPKYRSIRLGNPAIASKLLPAIGAMECLFEMGFQEGEDSLVLPDSIPLENLRAIRDEIFARRNTYTTSKHESSTTKKEASTSSEHSTNTAKPSSSHAQKQQLELSMEKSERPILQRIAREFRSSLRYEDKNLQTKALTLIPVKDFEIAAEKNVRRLQEAMKRGETKEEEVDIQEFMLLEVLDWFKNTFFSWVNSPECSFCKGITKFAGHMIGSLGQEENNRIEVYTCNTCQEQTLFPRYNDPEKLLTTRKGRCGEWANCFTLFCRCLGWDARLVIDETDHMWTEVYSGCRKRWLHCDATENVLDSPLMYEAGWKKELSYVIAYSKDEVQDVTWRYSCKHREVMSRRNKCTEEQLLRTMLELRLERQRNMSKSKQLYLNKRIIAELVEFLTPRLPNEGERKGRTSGSLTWRLARGEADIQKCIVPYVWTPSQMEMDAGKMHIQYSASRNIYIRRIGREELKGWENGVFKANSVFRKEEKDWKMVYLVRVEGSDEGSVSWKFDVAQTGMVVDTVHVMFSSQLFETGKVILKMCSSVSCILIPAGGNMFETSDFQGSTELELSVQLKGGTGDSAWQHAQLFRQELANDKDYPFEIIIKLKTI